MRVDAHPRFWRELRKAPAAVRAWATGWSAAVESPQATVESVCAGSFPLKGPELGGWHVRKYRDSAQGEYRLIFLANEQEVYILSLGSREDGYRTAARRARGFKKPVLV